LLVALQSGLPRVDCAPASGVGIPDGVLTLSSPASLSPELFTVGFDE
jgi:hypothetical protein